MLSGSGESSKSGKVPKDEKLSKEKKEDVKKNNQSVIITRGRSEARAKSRKKDDYLNRTRSFGDERRGGYRGRGRRDDFSRRFQDMKKTHDKYDYALVGLPEDSRISTCLRRLSREDDEKKFAALCKTVQDSLAHPDNSAYIRRSLDMILESLFGLLSSNATPYCRKLSALTLGHVGYALDKDFNRFMEWIFNRFNTEKKDSNRTLIMTAILELTKLDKKAPKLHEFAQELMTRVREVMEITDVGEIFIETTEITLTLTHKYPDTFTEYFHDTIDIIVGWHIDPCQPPSVTRCATRSLKRLSPYWLQEMTFTISLLQQFLEDADACLEEIVNPKENFDKDDEPISVQDQFTKVTAFIMVFKSVYKGLGKKMDPTDSPHVTWEFNEKSLSKVMDIVIRSLKTTTHGNLIVAGNKCIILIIDYLNSENEEIQKTIFKYIETLFQIEKMPKRALASLFRLISKVLDTIPNETTIDFVDMLLKPGSVLLTKRLTDMDFEVVKVYESLLHHSQLSVLLRVYNHFVADLQAALRVINPGIELCPNEENMHKDLVYDGEYVQELITFLLRALSEIAQANNPVTSIFALKPSIFEILSIHFPSSFQPAQYPKIHMAYMRLLKAHCTRNNYFISTASMLAEESENVHLADVLGIQAPGITNSSHLSTIVNLLVSNLSDVQEEKNKIFVLEWANELLTVSNRQYRKKLLSDAETLKLIKAVCHGSSDFRPNVILKGVSVLQNIVFKYHGLWPPEIIRLFMDLSGYFLNSSNPEIRKRFHILMLSLPSLIVTFSMNVEQTSLMNKYMVKNYKELSRGVKSEINPSCFKQLMNYLLYEETLDSEFKWMIEILSGNYPVAELGLDFGLQAVNNLGIASEWIIFQAACLCRDCKLRTPLGKPLETFLAIENAIRYLAMEIDVNNTNDEAKVKVTGATGRRVRMLIQFVEQLEKVLYNATEGTASAFPLVNKPAVKTFFSTNRKSCNEWFTRIRYAILVVSIHCGLSASAVRHGFALLQSHLDNGTTNTSEFQKAVLAVARALVNLGDKDAINGLYEWAKTNADLKEPILKPMAEMAARKYESASTQFKNIAENIILKRKDENEVSKGKNEDFINAFISDQLTESYLALNNWKDLSEWKTIESDFLTNTNGCSTRRYKYLTHNYVESMAKYDEGDYSAAEEMFKWDLAKYDTLFNPKRCTWDYNNLLHEIDHRLKSCMIKDPLHPMSKSKFEEAQSFAERVLEECLKDSPCEILNRASLLKYTSHSLLNMENYVISQFYSDNYMWKKCIVSPEMELAVWWSTAINNKTESKPMEQKQFILQCVKNSTKTGNVNYATKILLKYLNANDSLEHVAERYMADQESSHESMIEASKLFKKCGKIRTSVRLSSVVALRLMKSNTPENKALSSNLLRHISTEFKTGKAGELICPELEKLLDLDNNGLNPNFDDMNCFVNQDCQGASEEELLIGKILRLSLGICPLSNKSWERLANWAYALGIKESAKGIAGTPEERTAVESELPPGVMISTVSHMLAAYHSHDVDAHTVSSEMIEQQLNELGTFTNEQIKSLLDIWRKTHSRVYSYFRLSAYSYFKYIQISEYHEEDNVTVTATLRLLRLIVRHASELQRVVENGLSNTPTAPWIAIVPQLFSRLNHPEQYVRKRLSELLIRIGNQAPHLIMFPAIVGSGSNTLPTTKLLTIIKCKEKTKRNNEDDEDEDEEDPDDDDEPNEEEIKTTTERAAVLENSFTVILHALSHKYGEEINQVKMFITELRRITLLWDELWIGTLNQHQPDITRRFSSLTSEIRSTEANSSLSQSTKQAIISEKYRLILKPTLFVLEQLYAITFVPPETPHEKNFQEKYAKDIESVLNKLRQPEDIRDVNGTMQAISGLLDMIQANSCSGRRAGGQLSMKDISPALGKLSSSKIAMPGVLRDPATVQSISDTVIVLSTNTKPKKLVFHGSNGKKYMYLFKGLEDLHLDERIMQFLSIANSMLKKTNLRAHHYSVVPLGPRSGLISWVENVTPIFTLYKKWQERDSPKEANVMRPSAVFFSKLVPILKEAGITIVGSSNRSKWPVSALKKCLTELMHCTPTYLLSKEMWCFSINAANWWNITKLYSSSLAVMSMIGYIIGLGDRHLDNVLVNLKTGEVVHIDYNICFEKGKTLFIPEKVPFRLTQNLRAALGVTGVEGIYRQTCEAVLDTLRNGQETILTLLEAFVYDPLIDWTPLNEAGYTGAVYGGGRILASETKQSKKDLEREVTCCMFKVRLIEVKHQWLENKKTLLTDLDEFLTMIAHLKNEEEKIYKCQEQLKERHTQMALLKEAEGQSNHPLYTIGSRYAKHLKVLTAKQATIQALKTRIQESEKFINQFQTVMITLRGPDMARWIADVNQRPRSDVCQVFDLIKEFLHNAGRSQMVQQCDQSEKEVGELCVQQTQLTAGLLKMLADYWEISRQYPSSYINHHRTLLYKKWSEYLLKDMSPKTCEQVMSEMNREFSITEDAIIQAGMYSAGLHHHTVETTNWLAKAAKSFETHSAYLEGRSSPDKKTTDPSALTGVVLTALTALNKKFLMVESQATSAGDCLLNLMSLDGDWFLDHMCTVVGTAIKLLQLLPDLNGDIPDDINTAYKCLQSAYAQYNTLQGLHNNFTGVILIVAMQELQIEENSVVKMVEKFESIVSSILIPLSDLVSDLDNHLRFVILGMDSPHESLMLHVKSLRDQFDELLSHEEENMSQGQMLLEGFNWLFKNLEEGMKTLLNHLKSLQSPPAWKIVDQIREAMHKYTAPICRDTPMVIIEAMFFVKRIQTMLEVLRMTRADAAGFRGGPAPQVPHDVETLTRPVRKYIADFISYQMLGVFSLPLATLICLLLEKQGFNVTSEVEQKDVGTESKVPLEALCKKMVDQLNKPKEVRQASGVVSQAEAIWRQEDTRVKLERDLTNARALAQRFQLTFTGHHWLHEHFLVNSPAPPINRGNFLMEMRQNMTSLLSIHAKMKDVLAEQNNLILSSEQRLKWASGANPALIDVMSAFEASVAANKDKIEVEKNLALTAINMCNTILAFEALRTPTPEAIAHDNLFARIVKECEKTYVLMTKNSVGINNVEESLVMLLPPGRKVDPSWISNLEEIISESVRKLNIEIEPIQLTLLAAEDCFKNKALMIRSTMAKHHKIIQDIKTLLKSMIKYEEPGLAGLEGYFLRYKKFTDVISSMTKNIGMTNHLNPTIVNKAFDDTIWLKGQIEPIYTELLLFNVSDSVKKPLVRQTNVCESPSKDDKEGSKKPKRKGIQERNAYAMNVLRRVKCKLEGRDPDPGVIFTVEQQVNWTILEATNLENLALLYEGWTPWV